MPEFIDRKKLAFDPVENELDLSMIDPSEQDEIDTLGVRLFLKDKSFLYKQNNLTSVWKVRYENEIIGFFTVSMNGVGLQIIPSENQIDEVSTKKYPAILLGQMWVTKSFRGKHVAYWICQYVIGLARRVNPSIACSCIVLQTDNDQRKINVYKKVGFVESQKSNSLIWMYKSTN